jgi:hypothetical protein
MNNEIDFNEINYRFCYFDNSNVNQSMNMEVGIVCIINGRMQIVFFGNVENCVNFVDNNNMHFVSNF